MIAFDIRETHNFTFFKIVARADFSALSDTEAFESQLNELIEKFTEQLVQKEVNENRHDYDPVNGFWDTDSQEWANGWFEGNLDDFRNRATNFPDPSLGQSDNGSNGESTLCPRDLLNQHTVWLNDAQLEIKYIFLQYEDAADELTKQIERLFNQHTHNKILLNSIIDYMRATSGESEDLEAKANCLMSFIIEQLDKDGVRVVVK
jgi:hypothetical protein